MVILMIIVKILDNKELIGVQKTVTLAASFFRANVLVAGLKSKNIS